MGGVIRLKLEGVRFRRGDSCGVAFYNPKRDLSLAVHGDECTFCGLELDLVWIRGLMEKWFDIKAHGFLGPDEGGAKDVVILGRLVRYTPEGIEYEADPKHRRLWLEKFGFVEGSRGLSVNGDKEEKWEEWGGGEFREG